MERPPGQIALSERPSANAPAEVVDQLPQRRPVQQLVVAAVDDVAREREDPRPRRVLDADPRVLLCPHLENRRDGRERLDVVDDGGGGVETGYGGEGRLRPRLTALALERLEQRGFLSADVCAGAAMQHDRGFSEEVLALAQLLERAAQDLVGLVVLAPDVDEDVRRLVRVGSDQAALEEAEGHPQHDLAVLVRARLGLVGVDDEVVRLGKLLGLGHEAPLPARREGCPATPAQVARHERLDDVVRRHRAGLRERLETSRSEVVGEARHGPAVSAAEDDLRPVRSSGTQLLHELGHVVCLHAHALQIVDGDHGRPAAAAETLDRAAVPTGRRRSSRRLRRRARPRTPRAPSWRRALRRRCSCTPRSSSSARAPVGTCRRTRRSSSSTQESRRARRRPPGTPPAAASRRALPAPNATRAGRRCADAGRSQRPLGSPLRADAPSSSRAPVRFSPQAKTSELHRHYRSTSPMTPSSDPTIAMRSATAASCMQVAVASSATKLGARNLTRQGRGPPSETT